jgi:hypothetical protein
VKNAEKFDPMPEIQIQLHIFGGIY